MADIIPGILIAGRPWMAVLLYRPGHDTESLAACALIDTGAMRSAVSPRLAAMLNLPVTGNMVAVASAHGFAPIPEYLATIEMPLPGVSGAGRKIASFPFTGLMGQMVNTDLIIGQDLLALGKLTQTNGQWWFEFHPGV